MSSNNVIHNESLFKEGSNLRVTVEVLLSDVDSEGLTSRAGRPVRLTG